MDSLRHYAGALRTNPKTVIFCTATIAVIFLGGAASCKTGCECIDDCIDQVYGGSSYSSSDRGAAAIVFERNIGQADGRFEFIAQGSRHTISLAPTQAEFDFPGSRRKPARQIRATIAGAQLHVQGQAQQPLGGRVNYLRGNDPKKWLTDIPTFGRVTYPQIYPGIDLVFHGEEHRLEYDFVVAPHADPRAIQLDLSGQLGLRVEESGDLVIDTEGGEIRWKKPEIYQDGGGVRRAINGRFRVANSRARFQNVSLIG